MLSVGPRPKSSVRSDIVLSQSSVTSKKGMPSLHNGGGRACSSADQLSLEVPNSQRPCLGLQNCTHLRTKPYARHTARFLCQSNGESWTAIPATAIEGATSLLFGHEWLVVLQICPQASSEPVAWHHRIIRVVPRKPWPLPFGFVHHQCLPHCAAFG